MPERTVLTVQCRDDEHQGRAARFAEGNIHPGGTYSEVFTPHPSGPRTRKTWRLGDYFRGFSHREEPGRVVVELEHSGHDPKTADSLVDALVQRLGSHGGVTAVRE